MIDVAAELVKAGWAKVRESNNNNKPHSPREGGELSQEENRKAFLKDLEQEAKLLGKGLWNLEQEAHQQERRVDYTMPSDPQEFLNLYKGKPLDAIVEGVTNGSQIRARLLFSPSYHHLINLGIAGLRAPRSGNLSSTREGDVSGEEFGDESKFFVESRILQRLIKVTLLSLPTPSLAASQGVVQTANLFLGTIEHPAGNIASLLVSVGLAKIIDWHAGFLSVSPTPRMMSELRKAEQDAKLLRRGLWKDLPDPEQVDSTTTHVNNTRGGQGKGSFNAWVVKIWGCDMISLAKTEMGLEEKKVQLSSIRQPRPSDPKQQGLQLEGKEFLRKKLIGKQVLVTIDYVKPAEGDFESRECATVRLLPSLQNVSELLVERGYCSVLRHRQSDNQRSSDYDQLMAAEMKAIQDKKGLHSGKESPSFPLSSSRIIDASESSHKAVPFLSQFKRSGRMTGIVDFVASGSRFKIWIPKQDTKLTLVLSNIRTPRTARYGTLEKSEPFGQEALLWSNRKYLQREIEFLVESMDKSGGFIGKMFTNRGKDDVALQLVEQGLAKVDEYSSGEKELEKAQSLAQSLRKNLWTSYDPSSTTLEGGLSTNGTSSTTTTGSMNGWGGGNKLEARKEYVDVIVSEVRGGTETLPFSFSVQILKDGGKFIYLSLSLSL
jgi:staphylococcal nuclease domain-containing protein 1